MKWALVTLVPKNIWVEVVISEERVDGEGATYTQYIPKLESVNKPIGTIADIIEYDGVSEYIAEADFELKQVPDSAKIGDEGYGA